MKISVADIRKQYAKVKKRGWLPVFEREANRAGTTTAHLLAIGSRETNLENIRGDFRGGIYHGAGVIQVDIGTDPEYVKNWTKADWETSIVRGVDIYLSKVAQILKGQGRDLSVPIKKTLKKFVGAKVDADDVRRIATAAYNCGILAYYHFSNERNVDTGTTQKDYSRDVYDREVEFAKLREADGEVGAVERTVAMQGKYARAGAQVYIEYTRPKVIVESTPVVVEEPAAAPTAPKPEETPSEPAQATKQSISDRISAWWGTARNVETEVSKSSLAMIAVGKLTGIGLLIWEALKENPVGLIAAALIIVAAIWAWNRSKDRAQVRKLSQ